MKVVLRHQATGRYYQAPGKWVRRADNALAFEDAISAQNFLRVQCIARAQAVYRLAPYLMALLHERAHSISIRQTWPRAQTSRWYFVRAEKFERN
jgi:hypothetical protein